MQRDMDLVRKILLSIEANPSGFAPNKIEIEGFNDEQIGYHVYIMIQGGLVNGADVTHMGSKSPEASASTMTWQGHEFIEAARDENRWNEAKGLMSKAGGAAMTVWTSVLTSLVTRNLGL